MVGNSNGMTERGKAWVMRGDDVVLLLFSSEKKGLLVVADAIDGVTARARSSAGGGDANLQ